ncbi:MAG: TonB family protein [Pseudolabrys sp.]
MNVVRAEQTSRRWPEGLRWGICFALAIFFHGAGAAALLARWSDSADSIANAPIIMMELAPVAVAPETTPNEIPPGPQMTEAEPEPQPEKPVEKLDLPVQANAEPLPVTPPPKPIEKPKDKKPKQKHASLASAPSSAEQKAERAAGPQPGASSHNPDAIRNWQSQLVAQIERHKRYPTEANGDRGVARVAFSVDRSGGIHGARLVASSGSGVLDRDALAWLERSQPLPAPPPDVAGSSIPVTVPLRYNYR